MNNLYNTDKRRNFKFFNKAIKFRAFDSKFTVTMNTY
jgi:hypothetical protein